MLLCVDVGNTQIALGLDADSDADGEPEVDPPLVRDWRMRTDPRMTADELEVAFNASLGWYAAGGHRHRWRCPPCLACCASCGCSSIGGGGPNVVVGPGCAPVRRCWSTTRGRWAPTAS